MQKTRNSSELAMELRPFCIKPWCGVVKLGQHYCTDPLPELMLSSQQWSFVSFISWQYEELLFKSPQYTGGDFMFLYRFVRRRSRRRRPQILVHAITFEQLFGFLSFLAQLLALTCRLPDYILVDFRRDLDLDFSRSNMEFAISQPKLVRLPRNEKQTYPLNSRAQMWPSGLTLAMTLTLNFQGQI